MNSDSPYFDVAVKLCIYGTVADSARLPTADEIASHMGFPASDIEAAFARLQAQRLLFIEPATAGRIRMAPPFSGVPTQHRVEASGKSYFANCAWDALGIPAALHVPAVVHSRCGQSGEPLRLEVGLDGPAPSDWRFHCLVPAAHWWRDLVFT